MTIGDYYDLSLDGLSAGTLTVFRVVAVDDQAVQVNYNDVGVIQKVEI